MKSVESPIIEAIPKAGQRRNHFHKTILQELGQEEFLDGKSLWKETLKN